MFSFSKARYCVTLFAGILLAPSSLAAEDDVVNQQRELYDQAQSLIDQKKLSEAKRITRRISDYPLTPYLHYRLFSAELKDKSPQQVEAFIEQFQSLPFSTRIRAPYLDHLYRQNKWQTIADFQPSEPSGERYQCIYYYAQLKVGEQKLAYSGADKLWNSGKSVSDRCDALFADWNKAGLRTDDKVLERMELAFQQRNDSLIRYLNKQLKTQSGQAQGKALAALFNDPKTVTSFASKNYQDLSRENLAKLAFEKYARQDSQQARQVLEQLKQQGNLSEHSYTQMENYLAARYMSTDSALDAAWRDKVLSKTTNQTSLERRTRLAITNADWQGIAQWIALMAEEERDSIRWQYWLARSEIGSGKQQQGEQRLNAIMGQRNFYSAAAATYFGVPIQYPVTSTTYQKERLAPYQTSLLRIDELIKQDKITAAKSEWRYLLSRVDKTNKQQLAAYAANQNWHHLTVVATISAKMWDNLGLRFPVAHKWWFDFYAKRLELDPTLLMSLARQESAMDVEARSPVGARGIMQIMPKTARYTAKKHNISYQGASQLYSVGKNIEIGSNYLNDLLQQYEGNRIFALAAYNAGPSRVKRWRENSSQQLDAIAFVEAIPFRETRGYVQNILMFQVYYYQLMANTSPLLTQQEAKLRY
ncbi:murein transglycosylase [Vibrio hippocampi]|uniref:Soluble lytic murein transglycosylase n=1 Tax=Vibrio hippocampi TaxID=654686 RepID=A0ABN8DIX8_9VIBR|nr:murein transglycosylase [Vibrio hippocampi]CAH0527035.1 Soluble lytic murein transglycosylase [Vibrio hippocampi]